MKKFIARTAAIMLTAACAFGPAALANGAATQTVGPETVTPDAAGTFTLTVTVTGVKSDRGQIMAGLLKADPTSGVARNAGGIAAPAVEGTTILTFTGLSEGDYAVRLFHDENSDGEMSSNMFGIPVEGFAFSNGARAGFGPPDFSEMKVEVKADTTTTANMAYMLR
jgi:uncharacterized protein (DUF2141 family)